MGLAYASIRVKDVKKSVDFYTKQMGMRVTGREELGTGGDRSHAKS